MQPTTLLLGTVAGTSYVADLSQLPPGQYQIVVTRTDNSASALSQTFRINSPPEVELTSPNVRGDQSRNFAKTVVGNPWGPMDAADFSMIPDFWDISYAGQVFYGQPKNADPQWYMNLANNTIDTDLYRSLCFTMEDFGARLIGTGSVARFFWGDRITGALTTSQDIPLYTGLNEYCFADIAAVPVEANPAGGAWSGGKTLFRLDPHEFTPTPACMANTDQSPSDCHAVELDSVVLSPFFMASPGFTFTWTLSDNDSSDTTAHVTLALDTDQVVNGNEIVLYDAIVTTANGQFVWPGSGSVNYGTYNVLITASDGRNSVTQYATGPLLVGPRDGIFRNGFDVN